jgi:hypothetical protein
MPEKPHVSLFLILLAGLFSSCSYRFYQSDCDYPLPGSLQKQCILDSTLNETSGLLCMDGSIWTFNDSEGEAALYALNVADGSLIRKTIIRNAVNVDWEDITEDETHIFVADVGNNYASRDTLTIYRIPRNKLFSSDTLVFHDGEISFSFTGEVTRTRSGLSSHDCEAILAFGDSLYLFSKDWVGETTSVYALPKIPGHYSLTPLITYQAGFQVTGADIYPGTQEVALVGYKKFIPVVLSYEFDASPAIISCGGKARLYPMKSWRQVEGICYDSEGRLLISSEHNLKKQTLFRVGKPKP